MKASDNPFASLLVVEGSAPASPSAGDQRLFVDSADHLLKLKNSSGTVTPLGGGLADEGVITYLDGTVASAPGTPSSGKLRLYAKTGKVLAVKDDTGAEMILGSGGGGGITHSYIGYNTIGGTTEASVINQPYLKSVTLATAGLLSSIGLYTQESGLDHIIGFAAYLMSDSSGPALVIVPPIAYPWTGPYDFIPGANSGAQGAARWVHIPIGIWLSAGTYWLGVVPSVTTMLMFYDGSGSDVTAASPGSSFWVTDGGRYTLTTTSKKYSIRADLCQ